MSNNIGWCDITKKLLIGCRAASTGCANCYAATKFVKNGSKTAKDVTLSNEDILHYLRIVVALQETIELMAHIDAAIPSLPIQ